MITKIFDSGTSNGQAPVNYLLGDTDHTGQIRPVQPELVIGNPNTTIDLINSIDRKFKYTSGVLSFRYEEKPTQKQQLEIINDFRKSFMPGLSDFGDQIPNQTTEDRAKLIEEQFLTMPKIPQFAKDLFIEKREEVMTAIHSFEHDSNKDIRKQLEIIRSVVTNARNPQ